VQRLSCKRSLSTATGTGVEDFDLLPNDEAATRKGWKAKCLPKTLAAWRQTRAAAGCRGYTIEGRRILLHLMAGFKEDAETVRPFFEDMKLLGLEVPPWLLARSDCGSMFCTQAPNAI
jgi:hypothetical protein